MVYILKYGIPAARRYGTGNKLFALCSRSIIIFFASAQLCACARRLKKWNINRETTGKEGKEKGPFDYGNSMHVCVCLCEFVCPCRWAHQVKSKKKMKKSWASVGRTNNKMYKFFIYMCVFSVLCCMHVYKTSRVQQSFFFRGLRLNFFFNWLLPKWFMYWILGVNSRRFIYIE